MSSLQMVADLPLGLKAVPFADDPDPDLFVETEPHRRALAHIRYGLRHAAGIVVMTGDAGTGKTAVLSRFRTPAESVDRLVMTLPVPVDEGQSLLDALLIWLQREDAVNEEQDLKTALERLSDAETPLALFIDDAHELAPRHFADLLTLSNMTSEGVSLVQITLCGRTPLRSVLYEAEREAFRRRVVATYHLPALTKNDVAAYVQQRLALAGAEKDVQFTRQATDLLTTLAEGNPARINRLARHALAHAASEGRREVAPQDVTAAEEGSVPFAVVRDAEVVSNEDNPDIMQAQAEDQVKRDAYQPGGLNSDDGGLNLSLSGPARVDDRLKDGRPPAVSVKELNAAIEQMAVPKRQKAPAAPPKRRRYLSPQEMMLAAQDKKSLAPADAAGNAAAETTAVPRPPRLPVTELEAFVAATEESLGKLGASLERMKEQVSALDRRRQAVRETVAERIGALEDRLTLAGSEGGSDLADAGEGGDGPAPVGENAGE